MADKKEYREELERKVKDKFDAYLKSSSYPISFGRTSSEYQHIINIGISILETKYPEIGPGYAGGGFVQAVVDNDLMVAIGRADHICANNIKFFCTLLYNFSPYHLNSYIHEMQG